MLEVVAGIIYKDDKFLIAQRSLKKAQGGYWEKNKRTEVAERFDVGRPCIKK